MRKKMICISGFFDIDQWSKGISFLSSIFQRLHLDFRDTDENH